MSKPTLYLLIVATCLIIGCGTNAPNQSSQNVETPRPVPSSTELVKPNSSPLARIETLDEFERSRFYKDYSLHKDDGWKLNTGAYNNSYKTPSLSNVSIEVQTIETKVVSFGIVFFERDILSEAELNFVYQLLQSADTNLNVDHKVRDYIKTNAERHVFQIKQASPTTLGKLKIYAGKVGPQQTISIEKIGSVPSTSSAAANSDSNSYGIAVGTTADDVLAKRGKPTQTIPLGRDEYGLIVSWKYPDVTYIMRHRERDGISAYRVFEIR
jgi:hypothetical protein